jgi:NADH:ubiquinone oxidoreductase subunit 6 (subunit J)
MMLYLTYAVFSLYMTLILAGAAAAVFSRSLVRALVGLIASLFGVAGMYLLMNAPLIALMQLLIYVGAVGVLIFFAIMLTKGVDRGEDSPPQRLRPAVLLAGGLPAGGLFAAVLLSDLSTIDLLPEVSIETIGQTLLGPYILAFELISVVLLVAMAGAVLIGFERRKAR